MSTVTTDPAWATAVIAYWSDVDLRDVYSEPDVLYIDGDAVEVLGINVTATTVQDARRLGNLLCLTAEIHDPAVMWRTWNGWISEASSQCPVFVRVTAPTIAPLEDA